MTDTSNLSSSYSHPARLSCINAKKEKMAFCFGTDQHVIFGQETNIRYLMNDHIAPQFRFQYHHGNHHFQNHRSRKDLVSHRTYASNPSRKYYVASYSNLSLEEVPLIVFILDASRDALIYRFCH
mmetsp:Transcript_11714/g.14560  ORF Transcript_11714/g.14560 Transcript_11714/m.14560 type:complete len:125 (+) Transcript_11714:749-1123(+)